jgi:hypothetical protein
MRGLWQAPCAKADLVRPKRTAASERGTGFLKILSDPAGFLARFRCAKAISI